MAVECFELSDDGYANLSELAVVTGAPDLAKLVQDALRTYEWLIDQQVHGRVIISAEADDPALDTLRDPIVVEPFVLPDQEDRARQLFQGEG